MSIDRIFDAELPDLGRERYVSARVQRGAKQPIGYHANALRR